MISLLDSLRPEALATPESGIVAVVNHGRTKPGLIPLWVGEGDASTPSFISEAVTKSLERGETFYTWQRGIPELRQALADYHTRIYDRQFSPERFFVTGSGMQAIQLAIQAVAGKDDEVIVPSPVWPNITAALNIMGAKPVEIQFDFADNGWSLDIDKVAASITAKTRALFINSPGNPTGWLASRDQLAELLDIARRHGLWIIADEVYHRFVYSIDRAPSFYDVAEAEDRILFVNTFSKNWAMTGWRVGWISAPPELGQIIENLIQYSTSGVAAFMQRAAVEALEKGEIFLEEQRQKAADSRKVLMEALATSERIRLAPPEGAFYLFFAIRGESDSRALAIKLVDEANIGLAPGDAFGPGGGGFLRACFLRDTNEIREAATRLADWLARN